MTRKSKNCQYVGGDDNRSTTSCSETEENLPQRQDAPVIFCDFRSLLTCGSDLSFLTAAKATIPGSFSSHAGTCSTDNNNKNADLANLSSINHCCWFACVLWNSNVLKEIEIHEEVGNRLYSTLGLGRLMSTCVQQENQSWPGIRFMDWKKPFIMVEIINHVFDTCGSHPYLRVRETLAGNIKAGMKPRLWDLVIFKECKDLADEMVRRYRDGIKTTVILWGAFVHKYADAWLDGDDEVFGEIFLKSRTEKEDPLSILIFHHELMTKERSKRFQSFSEKSELWKSFQDSALPYKWFSNSSFLENTNHFSFHVANYVQKDIIVVEEEPHIEVIPSTSSNNEERRVTRNMAAIGNNDGSDKNADNEEEHGVLDTQLQFLLTQERGNTQEDEESDLEETVVTVQDEEQGIENRNDPPLQSQQAGPSWRNPDNDNRRQTRSRKNAVKPVYKSPCRKKSKRDQESSVQKMQTDSEVESEEDYDQYRFTALIDEI